MSRYCLFNSDSMFPGMSMAYWYFFQTKRHCGGGATFFIHVTGLGARRWARRCTRRRRSHVLDQPRELGVQLLLERLRQLFDGGAAVEQGGQALRGRHVLQRLELTLAVFAPLEPVLLQGGKKKIAQ